MKKYLPKVKYHLPEDNKPRAPLSRRKILKKLGLSAAMAPFLPLLESEAYAQGDGPKRLFLCSYPHGMGRSHWLPSGSRNNFTLNNEMHDVFQPFKEKMIVFGHLSHRRNSDLGHRSGMATLWSGADSNDVDTLGGMSTGPSIDQVLINRLNPNTRFSSLQFGVRTRASHASAASIIFKGDNQPVLHERNVTKMFNRIFGNNDESPEALQLRALRKSVLDNVYEDLQAINSKISATDRYKIEAHLDAVRAVELRNQPALAGCTNIEQPPNIGEDSSETTQLLSRLMIEQLIASAQCDLSRFFSLQYYQSLSNPSVRHVLHNGQPLIEGLHDLSHATPSTPALYAKYLTLQHWFVEEIAFFLKRLDETPDGNNGSMLDNSLVLVGSEIEDGPSHGARHMPYLMFGNLGGKVKTNQFIDMKGGIHQRYLTTVMQAFDQPDERFGNLDNTGPSGPIAGILNS